MIGIGVCAYIIHINKFLQDLVDYNSLPSNLKDRNYQVICALICWSLAVLEFLIACCFYRQIKVCNKSLNIAIGILKAAADFTREQCHAILIPVYVTILQIIFLAAWLVSIVYIFSSSPQITPIGHTPFGFI
jgi:choline transporter-like protein 2/4/5